MNRRANAIENLNKLANHLDSVPPEEFDMTVFLEEAPDGRIRACIAGHAATVFPEKLSVNWRTSDLSLTKMGDIFLREDPTMISELAFAEAIGLRYEDAYELVINKASNVLTPREAAESIRELIKAIEPISWYDGNLGEDESEG